MLLRVLMSGVTPMPDAATITSVYSLMCCVGELGGGKGKRVAAAREQEGERARGRERESKRHAKGGGRTR